MSQVLKEWPQEGQGGVEQLKSDTQEEILFSGLRSAEKKMPILVLSCFP
jgi:hypothetical protein